MPTINLVKQIKERRSGATQKKEGGEPGFAQRVQALSQAGPELDVKEKFRLVLLCLGVASVFGLRLAVKELIINPQVEAENAKIAEADQKIAEIQTRLDGLRSIRSEIESYETKMSELRDKLSLIETLQKGRNSIVRMVDFVVAEMPSLVWLTKLEIDNTDTARKEGGIGKVAVSGYAVTLQLVSEFIKRLEGAIFFPRWQLVETVNEPGAVGPTPPPAPVPGQVSGTIPRAPVVPPDAKKFELNAKVVSL